MMMMMRANNLLAASLSFVFITLIITMGPEDSLASTLKNDIRDVGSTADLVLVFLVHLVHWYPLVPGCT